MSSSQSVRAEFIEPLNRVLAWMLSCRNAEGAIICPYHRIEHTGKSAGALLLACALARHDPRADFDFLLGVAREQARRLVGRLEREGDSTCFTFRPGRHDPYNCSNSVIDGSACSDALVDCVQIFGEHIEEHEVDTFTHAAVLCAQTYLRYCILDKGIPAQKAWAMTGAAQAFRLSKHPVLEFSVREGARILAEVQRSDGSYPYHPLESGAGHPGAGDASSYYQSRVTAFLAFALERAGHDSGDSPWTGDLQRGIDFLLGLMGPDGIKAGLVEAKPWYHGANYEVASHPFDLYALGVGLVHLKDARCAPAMLASFRSWSKHLLPSGQPQSHLPGPGRGSSYQCPMFWAAHASWVARALPMLEAAANAPSSEAAGPSTRLFRDTGLIRLESGTLSAWVRGPRPAGNLHHGSLLGAGLIRVVDMAGKELLVRNPRTAIQEGEWHGRSGLPRWPTAWGANRAELRFSLWLARNALRGRELARAMGIPWGVFCAGILGYGSSVVSSSCDRQATLELLPEGARVRGVLAHRDGQRIPGADFERSFTLQDGGLLVRETCAWGPKASQTVPRHATHVSQQEGELSYLLAPAQNGLRT